MCAFVSRFAERFAERFDAPFSAFSSLVGPWKSALSVPVGFAENSTPPWDFPALSGSFSPPVVLPHSLARGLVLVLEMALFRVVPACAECCCAHGLFFLCAANAFLNGCRRLASASVSVARGTSPLGVAGRGQCGQDEEQGNLSEAHFQVERYLGELNSID